MVKIRSRTNTLQHAGMESGGYGGVLLYPQEYHGEGESNGMKKVHSAMHRCLTRLYYFTGTGNPLRKTLDSPDSEHP